MRSDRFRKINIQVVFVQVLDPKIFKNPIMSNNSSNKSSFADIVKTVTTIKTVKIFKVEKFSPVKASVTRSKIMSTPAYKRKRQEIESFSPIKDNVEMVQESKEVAMDKFRSLNFSIRRRQRNIVNRSRQLVSCKVSSPEMVSICTQTDEEAENQLIQQYIDEVKEEYFQRLQTGIALQVEKEKTVVLRAA